MAFKKLAKQQYPPRRWALISYPGDGKSTFSTQMRGPILTIDSDGRFSEVAHLSSTDIYQLSDTPIDNSNPDRIAELLSLNMPQSDVKTIVIDSLTAIIQPLVTMAIRANDQKLDKNKIAAFRDKAMAMRTIQMSVSKWGCDTLFIWHLSDGRDNKANEVTRETLPRTERNRLHSSLNMEIRIIHDQGGQRGIKVVWARSGRCFPETPILWDESGHWVGMPERIESAVYDGLTKADQETIVNEPPPKHFATPSAAIDWSMGQGVFKEVIHAQNVYDKLKKEHKPATAKAMRDLWVGEVDKRKVEQPALIDIPAEAVNAADALVNS